MPIYEYRCSACEHELEAIQKFSDAPLMQCPECHASTLVKKVSAAGFRLTGSGWYETDFKSGNKKNLTGDGAKNAADAPASSTPAANTTPSAPSTPSPAPTAAAKD